MVGLKYACTQPLSLLGATSLGSLVRYLVLRKGLLTSNICEGVAFVRTDAALPAPNLEVAFAPVLYDTDRPPAAHAFSIAVVCLKPGSSGCVELASANPLAAPLIHPDFFADAADLHVMIAGVELARRIAGAAPLAPYRGAELVPGAAVRSIAEVEHFVRQCAETIYHPVGTCRMGPVDDPQSVVDPEGCVIGVEGLRVVDASIMPEVPRANTHLTTVMIAEHIAARMKRETTA